MSNAAPLTRHISLAQTATGELVVKKSRFLCLLEPVESYDQAALVLAGVKKQHYNARHNCSAMVIGAGSGFERSSDDGEPQGTAGKPMLEVLKKNGVTNILAVVTRYFGGILLGAGGLARAYGGCVADTLNTAPLLENIPADVYSFTVDYAGYGRLCQLAEEFGATVESAFTEVVHAQVVLEKAQAARFQKQITHAFMGADVYTLAGERYTSKPYAQ